MGGPMSLVLSNGAVLGSAAGERTDLRLIRGCGLAGTRGERRRGFEIEQCFRLVMRARTA